jgi:O-antigen chain-terminating methyltransferase
LIARRLSTYVATPGGPEDGTDAGDLAAMESTSQFTTLAADVPAGRRSIRIIRRTLYRLLYPLLQQQTAYSEATARLVTQLASRVNVVERRTAESEDSSIRAMSMLDLEGAFRGSEEMIRERQRQYVGLFAGRSPVLDLGCGRGEFLGLLRDSGIHALGVDLDVDMVEHCRSLGHQVLRGDAHSHLRSLGRGTLGGIFCAQVVEHMAPGEVVALISDAARTLRPGGVLVLETVNPRSFAALSSFYLDLTHVRPYDALSVMHLMAMCGFVEVERRFLYPDDARDALASALGEALGPSESMASLARDVADKLYGPHAYSVWGYRPNP